MGIEYLFKNVNMYTFILIESKDFIQIKRHILNCLPYVYPDMKKGLQIIDLQAFRLFKSGPDGTRTRDLCRDRAAF
jgi:hypothetical protein